MGLKVYLNNLNWLFPGTHLQLWNLFQDKFGSGIHIEKIRKQPDKGIKKKNFLIWN